MPHALGRTGTQLRDHVINEKPSNHVYRVYRPTAALRPNYLANIYRDKGRRIDTNEITCCSPRLLIRLCVSYACTYICMYMSVRECVHKRRDDTIPRRSIVTRLIVARTCATSECVSIFYVLWQRLIPSNEIVEISPTHGALVSLIFHVSCFQKFESSVLLSGFCLIFGRDRFANIWRIIVNFYVYVFLRNSLKVRTELLRL